ncbi:hypothetical protein AB0K00_49145 [Dactylosporangium sp. NPDC049525]|uniref:hypothetical protein n=1 Tax=Dactylosporangium sp. NPDC049525 TaxID=3154730 RepID=UPI00342AC868
MRTATAAALVTVAVMLLALLRIRPPGLVIRWIWELAEPYPRVRRLLRPPADITVPTWRTAAKLPRRKYPLSWRTRYLQRGGRSRFVLVGGLYLDLTLTPIDVTSLDGREFKNLDTVTMTPGGAGRYFGKFLYEDHHRKSDLFSQIGVGDTFSRTLRRLLRRERWIARRHLSKLPNMPCAVSVHLSQRNRSFYTTFTQMGALSSLQWGSVQRKLLHRTRAGGVLYISGYFRTQLGTDLRDTLLKFPPTLLVCIDHGRFVSGDNPTAEAALLDAFNDKLIDVYFCTLDELRELMKAAGLLADERLGPRDLLTTFGRSRQLPPITVIRSTTQEHGADAFVLLHGEVIGEKRARAKADVDLVVGASNRFNASFVHSLVTNRNHDDLDVEQNLRESVKDALTTALNVWAERQEELDHDTAR